MNQFEKQWDVRTCIKYYWNAWCPLMQVAVWTQMRISGVHWPVLLTHSSVLRVQTTVFHLRYVNFGLFTIQNFSKQCHSCTTDITILQNVSNLFSLFSFCFWCQICTSKYCRLERLVYPLASTDYCQYVTHKQDCTPEYVQLRVNICRSTSF